MSHKFAIFIALAFVALAAGNVVRRDAPAAQEINSASELYANVEKTLGDLNAAVLKTLGFENNQQVGDKLKETGKNVASAVDTYIDKLQKETDSLKDNALVKDIRDRAKSIEEDLKKNHPETAADFENVSKSFQELAAKTQNLAKSDEVAKLRTLADGLLVDFQNSITSVINNISESVKSANPQN